MCFCIIVIILRFSLVVLQVWKTLEVTDKTLMDMIVGKDYDVTQLFEEEWQPPRSPVERDKRRGGRLETEEFYLSVSNSFDICIIRRAWDGRSEI